MRKVRRGVTKIDSAVVGHRNGPDCHPAFLVFSVKMMENLYIIKILIAAIEAVLLYLLYKFCISTIYAVIPWREAAHSTEEALHEKMLRYNLICRTLTVIFICFCMQIVL